MPKVVAVRERMDHIREFDFSLVRDRVQKSDFIMDADASFVVLSVEANFFGHVEKPVLMDCSVSVCVAARPMHEIALSHIVTHDSVIESRILQLEQLVDAILRTELDEDSLDPVERRMAQRQAVLKRLGYQPSRVLDHRVLVTPVLFQTMQRGSVEIRCGSALPDEPLRCRVTLRGVRTQERL